MHRRVGFGWTHLQRPAGVLTKKKELVTLLMFFACYLEFQMWAFPPGIPWKPDYPADSVSGDA